MSYAILAFDFGTKYIGCAVAQSITKTASPLNSCYVKHGVVDFGRILEHVKIWRPRYLVVGYPHTTSGDKLLGKSYDRFLRDLARQTKLKVLLTDETLTTKEARAYIFEKYGYKGLQKDKIDSISACLIAENWLNNNMEEIL